MPQWHIDSSGSMGGSNGCLRKKRQLCHDKLLKLHIAIFSFFPALSVTCGRENEQKKMAQQKQNE